MLRKLEMLLLTLMTALLVLMPAMGEEAPILIDRINSPKVSADFAFDPDAELLEIIFPQVLNADAMLLRCGGETLLVDCASAKQASRVTNMLHQMGVTELGAVLNTHPHYDHLQGLDLIAEKVKVDKLLICFNENINTHMETAMAVCKAREIPVEHYEDGDRLTLGDAVIDVWLKCDANMSLNEQSAQLRVQFGERTALLTADMMLKTQKRLIEVIPAELLDIDVLKYPHHGLNKLNNEFTAATTPIFSVVTNNGTKGINARRYLSTKHIPFAMTVPGFVKLTTDGTVWLAERIPIVDAATETYDVVDAPQEE